MASVVLDSSKLSSWKTGDLKSEVLALTKDRDIAVATLVKTGCRDGTAS